MKFSIRDLLLVTMIVALGVGWWADKSRLNGIIRQQAEKLSEWDAELAGLKLQLQSWPQVTAKYPPGSKGYPPPPGMKWQLLPHSSAPATNPPKP